VESLDLNDMPDDFTRLFWILLPLQLCRNGCGVDSAAWLRSKVFPLREDVTQEQVGLAFEWFVDRGMVEPYEVEGRSYFWVPTFERYQGNTSKEAESDYPLPPSLVKSNSGATPELVQSKSASDATTDANATTDADADAHADTTANGAEDDCLPESDVPFMLLLKENGAEDPVKLYGEWAWSFDETARYFRMFEYGDRAVKGIDNPIGYAIHLNRSGKPPPQARDPDPDDPRRFAQDGVET